MPQKPYEIFLQRPQLFSLCCPKRAGVLVRAGGAERKAPLRERNGSALPYRGAERAALAANLGGTAELCFRPMEGGGIAFFDGVLHA